MMCSVETRSVPIDLRGARTRNERGQRATGRRRMSGHLADVPDGIDAWTRVSDILADDRAVDAFCRDAPELLLRAQAFGGFPLGIFLKIELRADPAGPERILDHLRAIPDPSPPRAIDREWAPAADYEDLTTPVASARIDIAGSTQQRDSWRTPNL